MQAGMEMYGGYGREKRRRRIGLTSLFNLIMLLATVCFAVLLLCAYLAKHINPADSWFFALMGLGAPILFVINILLLLFWVVKWRLYVLVPFAAILVGAGNISLFFRPVSNAKVEETQATKITFMTYNAMGFMKDSAGGLVSGLTETADFIGGIKPDILCMQEYQATPKNPKVRIDSLLGMRYNRVHFKLNNSTGGGWGLAVYSKYPIVGNGAIDYPDSRNSTIWVDIRVAGDTVRVFNNHLQTTSVNREDRDYIDNQEFLANSAGREEKVRSIAGKLCRGFIVRAEQADSLAVAIASSPYRVIVCGDFNDTPLSYTYHTIRGDLRDAFVEKGAGMPSTYQGLFNLFRIDYVLHSKEIRTLSYDSPGTESSDHKPVVVTFDM